MPTPAFPTINGNFYDWSSVEIRIDGAAYVGIAEISYNHSLEPGMVYGAGTPQALGRTRGQYKADGSISIYRDSWSDILTKLISAYPGGIFEANFNIVVMFKEAAIGVQTDFLEGVRIKSSSKNHQQGNSALVNKFDLSIMRIFENGTPPYSIVPTI